LDLPRAAEASPFGKCRARAKTTAKGRGAARLPSIDNIFGASPAQPFDADRPSWMREIADAAVPLLLPIGAGALGVGPMSGVPV
jgi:hypothetical protein